MLARDARAQCARALLLATTDLLKEKEIEIGHLDSSNHISCTIVLGHAKSSLESPPRILVAQPLVLSYSDQPCIPLTIVPFAVLCPQYRPQRPDD